MDKKPRCMKCKHYSARALFSDLPEPIIQGTCTKCDKDIVANDPANEVPYWCPGYETLDKKYIKCPVCGGTVLNKNVFKITDDDGNGGCYPSCETCHGKGILEEKIMDLKNVTEEVNEAMNKKVDPTNPDHYKDHTSLECIEAMEIIFGKAAVLDFCACNAWKYIWRWKNKNGAEDLDKALWYAKRGLDNRYMDEPNYDRLKPILIEIGGYIGEIKKRSQKNED